MKEHYLVDSLNVVSDIALQGPTDIRPLIRRVNQNPELLDEYKLQRIEMDERKRKFHDIPEDVVTALEEAFGRTPEGDADDEEEILNNGIPSPASGYANEEERAQAKAKRKLKRLQALK